MVGMTTRREACCCNLRKQARTWRTPSPPPPPSSVPPPPSSNHHRRCSRPTSCRACSPTSWSAARSCRRLTCRGTASRPVRAYAYGRARLLLFFCVVCVWTHVTYVRARLLLLLLLWCTARLILEDVCVCCDGSSTTTGARAAHRRPQHTLTSPSTSWIGTDAPRSLHVLQVMRTREVRVFM